MRDANEAADAWFRLAGWFATPAGRALERRLRARAPKARPNKVLMAFRAVRRFSGKAICAHAVYPSQSTDGSESHPYQLPERPAALRPARKSSRTLPS